MESWRTARRAAAVATPGLQMGERWNRHDVVDPGKDMDRLAGRTASDCIVVAEWTTNCSTFAALLRYMCALSTTLKYCFHSGKKLMYQSTTNPMICVRSTSPHENRINEKIHEKFHIIITIAPFETTVSSN